MRALLVAAAVSLCTAAASLSVPALAAVDGGGLPVDAYASYQPQKSCTKQPKPGTVALGSWLLATYGGAGGAVNRDCSGSGASEHKDGRAIDWTMSATSKRDRATVRQFLDRILAADGDGTPHARARRMGVMYVIWNDRMYASYRGFEAQPYLSSSCRSLRTCSRTLRHRDHVHISLSEDGGWGRTTWYAGRL